MEHTKYKSLNRVIVSNEYSEYHSISDYNMLNSICVATGVTEMSAELLFSVRVATTLSKSIDIPLKYIQVLGHEFLVRRREFAISKLSEVVNMLDKIDINSFKFGMYCDSRSYEIDDTGHICSTVGCVVGWMPKYMPQVDIEYILTEGLLPYLELKPKANIISKDTFRFIDLSFSEVVMDYLGINQSLYAVLFLPNAQDTLVLHSDDAKELITLYSNSSISDVKANIVNVIEYISLGYFDHGLLHNLDF